jgi:hypothetical protein
VMNRMVERRASRPSSIVVAGRGRPALHWQPRLPTTACPRQ